MKTKTVKGKFFDTLLTATDFDNDEAYDYADAMEPNWNEHQTNEEEHTHMKFIDAVNGSIIWLDTLNNYYRFEQFERPKIITVSHTYL